MARPWLQRKNAEATKEELYGAAEQKFSVNGLSKSAVKKEVYPRVGKPRGGTDYPSPFLLAKCPADSEVSDS